MDTLQSLSREDEAARERLNSASEDMVQRTCSWSDINTGSWISRGFPLDHVASSNLTAIQLPAWLALAAALNFARKEAAR